MAKTANLILDKLQTGQANKETSLNTNADRLDAVVGGYLPITLTDANRNLTESEQCNRLIIFSGTLTAGRTIGILVDAAAGDNPPTAKPRDWIFLNSTGQTLTFKLRTTAGGVFGSGATLATTKKASFYHTNPAAGGASGDVFKWTTEV
jgi:hypothetical protein